VALRAVLFQHEGILAQAVEVAQIGRKAGAEELPAPWVAVAVVEAVWDDLDLRTSRALHADLSTESCKHRSVAVLADPVASCIDTDRSRHHHAVGA
jgi:hypothetical protein